VLTMSEDQLLEAVMDCAVAFGWRRYHPLPARQRKGGRDEYRTPFMGEAGWPDLALVHPRQGRFLIRELKAERGLVDPEQLKWLDALTAAGVDVGVWRPSDWTSGRIERTLRGPA